MEVLLHIYHAKRRLLLLEYRNRIVGGHSNNAAVPQPPKNQQSKPPNVLLFIGGLYDTFRSPGYVEDLAALFPIDRPHQRWRVMHVQLTSAGRSFGLVDLDQDVSEHLVLSDMQLTDCQVDEISTAIRYIRDSVTKSADTPVVIMGHSTGCQDVMHYLCSPTPTSGGGGGGGGGANDRSWISGAIMQAPVSDREAILHSVKTEQKTRTAYEASMAIATQTPLDRHDTTILPTDVSKHIVGPAPINITRFLSLASPNSPAHPSMDDYFSSDLPDRQLAQTFGRIGGANHFFGPKKEVLVLESGSDEAVPAYIDKELLVARWRKATTPPAAVSPHSLVVPHAKHDISGTSLDARTARLVLMRAAVLRYLEDVVGDVGRETDDRSNDPHAPWAIWTRDRDEIEAERAVTGFKL